MLQTQSVYPETLGVLKELMQEPLLKDFYLVGGTALALQIGHRISVDIDLFTNTPFDSVLLSAELKERYSFKENLNRVYFLQGQIKEIKVDVLKYPYKPLYELVEVEGIRMVVLPDIASMKMAAITNRGRKRDFIDLYFLLKSYSLKQIIEWYQQKYDAEIFMLLQSLVYFEDADNDIDLNMIIPTNWEEIKTKIRLEVQEYLESIA
ncbi:nucleotidyl transferase AbiEii/AbiGii toxin family protein [Emticicia soli]|uniref:Nucleotidyl transferase AbiEii/AbiGii toxin family protein n=1 Tax=Emticicia soli TaxID=2027878 RepID=A0ABW5J655_9BACT